jgi:quercetin dioxygenase-like cupin family protein
MSYHPSPRPTFDGPAYIPYENTTRHLWGDTLSGEVADWIYVSSDKIHQLLFGLPAGGWFRHSEDYRTVFAADEVLYVISGLLVIANPETGEVHPVKPGEAAFFRHDTWHHAFNHSAEPLRVLELFAPPPSQGTSGTYARTKPYLHGNKYNRHEWLGQLPMRNDELRTQDGIRVLRETDLIWQLEGCNQQALVGLFAATEHLTVGKLYLQPGQRTESHTHGGDEGLYVLEGTLNILVPDNGGQRWFELKPGDGFYIPEGVPHQYHNLSQSQVSLIFGVAPSYLPK